MKTRSRIIIIGAGGRLGAALAREYSANHEVTAFNRAQLDLTAFDQLRETLGVIDFRLLINCAGLTSVDGCEKYPAEAFLLNAEAPAILAQICAEKNAR